MATIRVNSKMMRDKADSFERVANSIRTFTNEMTQEIESLKTTWEGQSAETLVNKFRGLKDDFEEIYDTINQYAKFLDQAAESYDKTEAAITADAESQRN